MKRLDELIPRKKNPSLLKVSFLKKSRINRQKMVVFEKLSFWAIFLDFFFKWDFAESLGFLRCNPYIKALPLSYQTPQYADFLFLAYDGFLQCFRPLVAGVKHYKKLS